MRTRPRRCCTCSGTTWCFAERNSAPGSGAPITRPEGRASLKKPHPIQQAFIDEQAMQCGFCVNGVIMTAKAFLDRNPKAGEAEIQQAMSGVLCRCHAHTRMVRAINRYAKGVKA